MAAFFATSATPVPATITSSASGSPRFEHVRLATSMRMRFAVQGSSPLPLILLHGYSDSWFSYSSVLGGLARSCRVYAPDLRGHGDSDRPPTGYTMADMAADVVAFMDATDIARATVVGHSMGSFVAQQVAARWPARVAQLVLVGSGTTPRNIAGISELAEAVQSLRDPVPLEFVRDFQLSTIYRPIPTAFLDSAVTASLTLPARTWRDVMAGMLATGPEAGLGEYRGATLILWGDRDVIFDRSEQDALLAAVPGAVLKIYRDTGHALHWERPEAFIRDLEDFLLSRQQ